jgi:hypothetical protein
MDFDEKNKPRERCPALGFEEDPNTSTGEPSSWNFCHRVDPIATPNYAQQSSKCLTSDFRECPIYKAKQISKMPEDLLYKPKVPFWKKYSKYLGALGVLVVAIIVWLLISDFRASQSAISPQDQRMTSEAEMLLTLIAQPTETIDVVQRTPTPTKTAITATETRTPFPTRTPKTATLAPFLPSNTPKRPSSGGNNNPNPAPTSAPPPTQAPPPTSVPTQPPAPTDPVRPTP